MRAFWILLLLLTPAPGQEEEPPPPAPESETAAENPQALFATAMLDLKNMGDILVRAKVRRQPGEAAGFAGGRVILGVGGGDAAEPFEGDVEAWRDRDGSVLVVSHEELPGFVLYRAAGRTLQRQDYEEKPVSLAELEAELVPLLDPDRLTQHLMAADLTPRRDSAGKLLFEGAVPREVVKVIPNPAFMVGKRTLRTKAKVVLSAEGRLEHIAFAVVHNDPLREMMRGKAGFRVVIGPNGQPQPQPGGEDDESHDIEGDTVTYALDFGATEPSERARAARRDLKRLHESG